MNPTHAYTTAGTFAVSLTVTASGGGTNTSNTSATITTALLPTANAGGPYTGVVGQALTFDGSKSAPPGGQTLMAYSWNFGDGSSGTGPSPSHTYVTAGTFTVSVTVTASGGGTNTASTTATISALPVANAGGPYSGSVGQSITFDGSKSSAPAGQTVASYTWSFGDNSTGNGVNPTHSYASAGTYTVTLSVTSSGGGSTTATATVTVSSLPVAVSGAPYTGTVGQSVAFDGSKSSAPAGQTLTSYLWDFGDSSTGTGVNPSHMYAAAGSYTVTLTVTSSSGATAKARGSVTITALPVASAGGPYTGNVGQAITFDGSQSTAPTGRTLTSYTWDFGDRTSGTGVSVSHSYSAPGTYTLTLTVADASGATAKATASATINALPVANAGGPYTANAGQTITFDGSHSTAPAGQTITGYSWDFGDSSTGTGVGPTHTYAAAGTYTVTLTVSASGGGTMKATATVTVNAAPVANAGGPYTGTVSQAIAFDGSKSTAPSGQTLSSYTWDFGDKTTGSGATTTHAYSTAGTYTATLTVTASSGPSATATASVTIQSAAAPNVSGFFPASGSVGTVVTVTGTNLAPPSGSETQVTLVQQGGGTISAPVSTVAATSLSFVVPAGAATGVIGVVVAGQSTATATPFTVTTSSSYTLSVSPATATVIQGQSTSIAVTISSTNNFPGLASLAITGVPSGVTATFQPSSIAVGQTSILTLAAPASQTTGTSQLALTASATVEGQAVSQAANAALNVQALSTTFLGRTVVDDAVEQPIAGATVKFLGVDDKGNHTGCSASTVSDGGGNFLLTGLPAACVGPQLISYDGLTATAPAGKFAGVNLSYTLKSGQVVASPVLVHLPRIDNAETVQVQQNASTDQVFYFHTIPGVKATVYAGTTLTMPDGTTPNPFPLVGISIPLDRLPEQMPTNGMLMPFIVAFQPANAVASQPVAVNFPNSLGVAPNTHVTFVTLDPTRGYMVPYGTGTVSSDGSQFVADSDPNHTGHAYGLVHFDWHGPAAFAPPENSINPSPDNKPCCVGGPVDVSSGIVTYTSTDIQIGGRRGGLSIERTYRTLTTNAGAFGTGTAHQYSYVLDTSLLASGEALIKLVTPNGSQFPMNQTPGGVFVSSNIPMLRGAVLSGSIASGTFSLRWIDGSVYQFQLFTNSASSTRVAFLTSMTDANGNTTTLTRDTSAPLDITKITDAVGRSLTLTYDSSNRITQIVDPIGRKLQYTYNGSGTLDAFTDAAGGVTRYTYTSGNNLASITDPRGTTTEQNTYNESFDGRVTQQVEADGGTFKFAYTLQNPKLTTSPVLQTVVTDPRGNQTTYRFDMQGFMVSAMDASGQTRELTHDPSHSNLISDYTGNGVCPVCGDPTRGDVHYTYDEYGNAISMTDALGNKTSMTYDNRFGKVTSVTDALGKKTAISYDSNGNPVSVADANGHITATTYDSFGEPIETTDASGAKTTLKYDSFGNVNSVTNALGNTTSFTYDGAGRLTQVQDALGRHGQTSYDALDRVTKVTDPLNNATQLAYDAVGDLLSLTDPKGNATSFVYDSRQRLSTRTDPLKRSQSYTYDGNSNLTQFTDRRGQVSKFDYDVVDRLHTATYQDSTVTNTYDAAGRLLNVSDSMDGQFGYKYDAAGRLLQQSMPTGVVQYTRDALGRIVTKQVVGQPAASYTYDAVGNVLTAALPSASVTFTYDSRDLPLTLSRTNGVVSTYSFDSIGELLTLVHAKGATVLNSQAYQYDTVGKRIAVANDLAQPLTTQSATYTVDANNQLVTGTTAAGTTQYTFDANGNRQTETTPAGKVTYTWDARNRLSQITNADGSSVAMHYDYARSLLGFDNTSGTTTTSERFVVDSTTNITNLATASGSQFAVLSAGNLDANLATTDSNGKASFGIFDALGSNLATTSDSGVLDTKLSYEPYGQMTGNLNNAFPFLYTGKVEVGAKLYYSRHRYYDSNAGRFLSEDPSDFFAGVNLYEYGGNDPTDYTDPTGLDSITLNYFPVSKQHPVSHIGVSVNGGASNGFNVPDVTSSVKSLLGMTVPAVEKEDMGTPEPVTFDVSHEDAMSAQKLLDTLYGGAGDYNFYRINCAVSAGNVLRAAGIDLDRTIVPYKLYREAQAKKLGLPAPTIMNSIGNMIVSPAY